MADADWERAYWDRQARFDPLWAILSDPSKAGRRWDLRAFLETGRREVSLLMYQLRTLGIDLPRRSALDFGCGVGRLTQPLAAFFDRVVGVDISPRMVARARELTPACEFVVNSGADLAGHEDAAFDLVLSSIVLQHVPRREWIEAYLREFVRVLAPGGAIVFTLPSHIPLVFRAQWRRRLYHALRRAGGSAETVYRRLRLQPIAMSHLDERRVTATLEAAGARVLRADTWAAAGLFNRGVRSTRYFATR
jgi:SAM-dependent methyltransferase